MNIGNLNIKIFADGADYKTIINSNNNTLISGFTTNPTLMRKDGVKNYRNFAQKILSKINKKPVSFEVFADDFDKMFEQAKIISSWSDNVNVKIPKALQQQLIILILVHSGTLLLKLQKLKKLKCVCQQYLIFS